MKSASLPAVRVEPELRAQVEAVLHTGESLSQFVEDSVKQAVMQRALQAEFVARGMASLAKARKGHKLLDSDAVLDQLQQRLDLARKRRSPARS